MKILAYADVHGSMKALREIKQKAKDVDLLVDCGDMSIFGEYMERHLKFLSRIKKPVFIIDGNHEDKDALKKECKKYDNITYIDQALHPFRDTLFVGYGGGGFAEKDKEFEKFIKKNKVRIGKWEKVAIVTHGPPYGCKQDTLDKNHNVGNKSYKKAIKEVKPKLWLCGHIHENSNTIDKFQKTVIVNPGPQGRIIKL